MFLVIPAIKRVKKEKMNQKIIILSLITAVFYSCDRPGCDTTNRIFTTFPSNSLEYKKELATQIEENGLTSLSYWFSEYVENDGQEFMKIHIQGDNICAEGFLFVKEWDEKIENIRRVEGKSYRGAELAGLKFSVENREEEVNLIYQKLERIID
ncbi:hypothetical protein [Tunicatimonas pelagia]|uniref:hypothetical protein n=1 Tax=Tunicatimonas pelagia TaxID=931531 RepID=UPI002666067F|nr:hypothetical protein [Tunicatimonas pelagia]WKN45936.1 hypothetical protein P0M28_13310 [Tunicatimonas pelagia]